MIKNTKLTDEELKQVQDLQKEFNLITFQLGELHIVEYNLNNKLDNIKKEINNFRSTYKTLQDKEKELITTLESTYPNSTINFETGELS